MDDKVMVTNQAKFNEAIADLTKAADLNPYLNAEFTEIGIKLYTAKAYLEASKLFELAVKNTNSKSFSRDSYLLGNAILYYSESKTAAQKAALRSVGVDPTVFSKGITATQLQCFTSILGAVVLKFTNKLSSSCSFLKFFWR